MDKKKNGEEKLLITFSDIITLFKQSKFRIMRWAVYLGVLGALFALIQPIRYRAEATFREKSMKSGGVSNSILQLFGSQGSGSQEHEATSLIKSRKIMQEVIEKLHLQATIEQKCKEEHLTQRIRRNLKISLASFTQSPQPVLEDPSCVIKIDALEYNGEIPLNFLVDLKERGIFEVHDGRDYKIIYGKGRLGVPFKIEHLNFTLIAEKEGPVDPQLFSLKILPMKDTANQLCKILQIENEKTDKGVLKLFFDHRNRQKATDFVNHTMDCYQNYLKANHDKIARMQLDYLHLRQSELASNLNTIMQKHASFLANDLYNSGFIDSDKEMDFLAKSQHEYREKLLKNELEIKRLENLQPNTIFDNEKGFGDAPLINTILIGIRELKQRRDGLEIEIQKKGASRSDDLRQSFDNQIRELEEVQDYTADLQDTIDRFHQHLPPNPSALLNDPRFLMRGWFDRLEILERTDPVEWQKSRESFQFYLNNIERLFNVHEKILLERLTHQQNPTGEYQGVDIRVAEELYIDYSKRLIQLESTIRQNLFFIKQIEEPNFEITSLSSELKDPISQDMILRASQLVLTLKDQNNQSIKEQERLKDELHLQRTFLTLHLQQMVELMQLNKVLIEEKIFALQNVSLELIHQNISLQENTLIDYVESRLENLRRERQLIKQHLRQIHKEMEGLPNKWIAEQLIQQEVATNQLIVEEIAKMVESKNITHNLEVIQSAPIDIAIPPVHPIAPNLLFSTLLGGFFGCLMGSGLVLGSTLRKGLKASAENLKLAGYHVSGHLSSSIPSLQGDNLETLRRLHGYIDPPNNSSQPPASKKLLLIEGKGPEFSSDLAELLKKRNKKIILLDLNFDQSSEESSKGLLQYLEGSIPFPVVHATPYGDKIEAGGFSAYSIESLSTSLFKKLLDQLETRYDWVIAYSRMSPLSAEAESLAPLFSAVAVTLKEEKIDALNFYERFIQNDETKVSFILVRK